MSLAHAQHNHARLSTIVNKGSDFFKPLYKNDGSGRDSYIHLNAGGLTSYTFPSMQMNNATGLYVGKDQRGVQRENKATSQTKTVNYN